MFSPIPAEPFWLAGDAHARGLGQASLPATSADAVRRAVYGRLDTAATLLARPDSKAFLAAQMVLLRDLDPDGAAELDGIGAGFAIAPAELLAYLHLGVLAERAEDGCSTFVHGGAAPLLAKNRDYRGEHAALQRVFRHRDPARPGEDIICVGSLGSPGAFSSGMNSHGLALVDTHVGTRDHGPGLLRYFLMTRLLWHCRTVAEALAEIRRLPHAGGGTITLADAAGAHAAVELGHAATAIVDDPRPYRVRTNHFCAEAPRQAFLPGTRDPQAENSIGRRRRLQLWLAGCPDLPGAAEAAAMLACHGEPALCRHGEDGGSGTISAALFAPASGILYFCPENPCSGHWYFHTIGPAAEVQGEL
jgi:hypothetical protein